MTRRPARPANALTIVSAKFGVGTIQIRVWRLRLPVAFEEPSRVYVQCLHGAGIYTIFSSDFLPGRISKWVRIKRTKRCRKPGWDPQARLGQLRLKMEWPVVNEVDGSFHSPEWHAARLASLNTSHTITWEEYKKKQKEDELKKGELEADTDRMMKEYRAQLDAERARKLAHGRNRSSSKSSGQEKDRKNRDLKKRSKKKRKHSKRKSSESSSSSSSSDSSSSDEEERESRRSKSRSKRSKREKKHRSRSKHSSSDNEEADGPVPLSRFFEKVKN